MSFIWNDSNHRLIDEQEEYDKNSFVIVKRLFVTLQKSKYKLSNPLNFHRSVLFAVSTTTI